jgi:YHS domain-containing protein
MSDVKSLEARIEVAFNTVKDEVTAEQQLALQDHLVRQKLFEQYEQVQARVVEIARPRLQALADRAAGRATVTPSVCAGRRKATFEFHSAKALITLSFSVAPDRTLKNAVVEYDLSVVPVLWKFDTHAEFTSPVDSFDTEGLVRWLDDRIVGFVELYIQVHKSEIYDKAEYVEDPVANVRFPKFAAGASLDYEGKTYFFVDDTTRAEFARRKGVAAT